MSVSLLTTAAFLPRGVHSPASADRLHIQSLPERETWRALPIRNDVGGYCNTGPGGSIPGILPVVLRVE